MKRLIAITFVAITFIIPTQVHAAGATEQFAQCLVDGLTGKERKALAKWIFFAIAAHPEISTFSSATPQDIEDSDKFVGSLITRMLTEDCPAQLKAANAENPLALQSAFELVGQVAMQELMSNQNVTTSISNYSRYADLQKINALMAE